MDIIDIDIIYRDIGIADIDIVYIYVYIDIIHIGIQ